MDKYHYVKAYSVSKYAQLLISLELADVLKEKGITVNAVNPGTVRTTIMRTNKRLYDLIINILMAPWYVDAKEGAKTCIYLATSGDVKNETGKFYRNSKPAAIPKWYNSRAMRKKLLRYYETLFGTETP